MKFFSRMRKKLKNYIFTDDFDQKYQTTSTKMVFILYCCCGGFCFHEDVRGRFKKFWIIFNLLNSIFVNGSCLFYFANAPINNNYYAMLLPAPTILGLLSKWGVYIWVYFAKNFFSKFFDHLDDKDSQSTQSVPPPDQRENYAPFCSEYLKKSQLQIIVGACCVLILSLMIFDYEKFISYDYYFMMLYPVYVPREKTWAVRSVVRFVQLVTITPELIIFWAMPSSIVIITADIYNRFELMSLYLRDASYSTFLRIDEIYSLEIAMDEERIPSSLTKIDELKIKKALAQDNFVTKTILVMKYHRRLYSIAKLYQEKMNSLSVATNMMVFSLAVICGFFISSVTETKSFDQSLWILTATICIILMTWLLFCFTGEMYHTMNDLIATEIYFSPWYHLEPKERRLILTYLAILQRPISITNGGVFPVNLSSYPDTVNNIYSHVQILRTLQSKSKRS